MQYPDDIALIDALKAGDTTAYDQLFRKYYKLLWANAFLVLKDELAAEDVVQEFFIDIWEKQLYHRMEGEIKGYLFKAVYNRSLNHIKKMAVETQRKAAYEKEQDPANAVEARNEQQAEFRSRLKSVLQEFPGQRRQAFTLVYLEEKKYQEAAEEMNVSVNSIKTHLRIALKIIRERLKKPTSHSPFGE